MTFSWKRVNAIFMKDYKDFSRNLAVSIIIFMPPALAALYGRMGGSIDSHIMLINMALAMVAAFVQSCLIAEEKEKNTLRGLMLSPASTTEILVGKSSLTFVLTLFTVLLSMFFAGYNPANIAIIAIAILLSTLFYIGLGTMLGLYAKSVMEASLYVTPVILLFSFGTFIPLIADKYPILKALQYLPNIQLLEIGTKVETGAGFGDILLPLAVIAAWGIAMVTVAVMVYRKRTMD